MTYQNKYDSNFADQPKHLFSPKIYVCMDFFCICLLLAAIDYCNVLNGR